MPKLSFKVASDWQEVVRLREQIRGLKSDLKGLDVIGNPATAKQLEAQLSACIKQYDNLLVRLKTSEAQIRKQFSDISDAVDFSKPQEELRKFDAQVLEMCRHLDSYLNGLKGHLQDVLSMLGDNGGIMGGMKNTGADVSQVEELKRKNEELIGQLKERQAELEKERELYQQLAEAVRNNSTSVAQLTQGTQVNVRELSSKIKNINKEIAEHETYLSDVETRYENATKNVEKLREKLAYFKEFYKDKDNFGVQASINETSKALEKAEKKAANLEGELEAARDQQGRLNDTLAEYERQMDGAGGKAMRVRTMIMNAREDMVNMIAAGQTGSPMFYDIASNAGKMRKEMALANAYMQYFADPNKHLTTLKQGLQGVAGGASLVVGVMGLFNEKSEQMAEIQTKIQSLLGIIVGLETTYTAVKRTSNVMIAIGQIQSWASAKAKAAEAIATEGLTFATVKATVAQAAFNLVAKANPYILLFTLITTVVGGLYLLTKSLSEETEEQKKAAEAAKRHAEELRKMHEAWTNDVASSASKQITSYNKLQRKWNELGNDLKAKKKFVKENQSAFNELGWAVNSVTDAENLLVNNTDAVVNAIMARAKAAAYEKVAAEEMERQIRIELEKGTIANGAYKKQYHKGQRLTLDEARQLEKDSGVKILSGKTTKGVAFSTDVEVLDEKAMNEASQKQAEARRKAYKKDKDERIQESKDRQQLIQDNLQKEVDAEKEAAKKTGVPLFSGNTTKSGSGHDSDNSAEKLKEEIDRQKVEQKRAAIDLAFSTREAEIDAMEEGSEKIVAQIELDHDKQIDAIERSYEDMRLKRIEAAKKLWDADPKNKDKDFFESDSYKNANINTKEEDQNRNTRILAANAQYNRSIQEQRRQDIQAMYDYLKEYGSFEEKRLAVAQEYAEKIKDARTPAEKAALTLKMEEEQRKLSQDQSMQKIDWSGVFNDLQGHTKEYLEGLRDQLQGVLSDGNLGVDDMARVQERIRDINAAISEQGGFFDKLSPLQIEYNRRLQEEADAKDRLDKAMQEGADAETQANNTKAVIQGMLGDPDATVTKDMKNPFKDGTEEYKRMQDLLQQLYIDEGRLEKAREKTAKATVDAKNAEDSAKTTMRGKWDKTRESIEDSDIYKNVSGVPDLLKGMGLGDIAEKAQKGLNGFNDSMGAVTDFMEGNYIGALTKGISAISNFGDALGLWSNSNREEIERENERLANATSVNTEAINRLTEEIKKTSPSKAYEAWEDAERLMKMNEKNAMLTMENNAAMYDGGHSLWYDFKNYYADGRYAGYEIAKQMYDYLNKRPWDGSYDLGSMLHDFTAEDWNMFLKEKPDWMTELGNIIAAVQDDGNYNGMFQDILNFASEFSPEAYKELWNTLQESVTGVSFDSFKGKWTSMLMDLSKKNKDFADDFVEQVTQSFLEAQLEEKLSGKMQAFYDAWAKALEDNVITDSEMESLRQQEDLLRQRSQEIRDMVFAVTGYDRIQQEQQSATFNFAQNITYEQADALVGIETAQTIAVEQGNAKKDTMIDQLAVTNMTLDEMRSVAISHCEIADDTRDILASSYLELKEANEHLDKIEKSVNKMGNTVDKIKDDIKDLK